MQHHTRAAAPAAEDGPARAPRRLAASRPPCSSSPTTPASPCPSPTPTRSALHARPRRRDLVDYLKRFEITLAADADGTGHRAHRVRAGRGRGRSRTSATWRSASAPSSTRAGLAARGGRRGALSGLRRAEADHDITTAVIVCGLRNLPVQTSIAMAELAVAFRDRGVVAFDLAGAERGHPPIDHQPAFQIAADANMPVTIHAGEAFGPASIHQAVHACTRAHRPRHAAVRGPRPDAVRQRLPHPARDLPHVQRADARRPASRSTRSACSTTRAWSSR
jgi:adenosine deaminase